MPGPRPLSPAFTPHEARTCVLLGDAPGTTAGRPRDDLGRDAVRPTIFTPARTAKGTRCTGRYPAVAAISSSGAPAAGRGSNRTMTDLEVGVLLPSAVLSSGTSTLVSGK
jgi:hypothetical protein